MIITILITQQTERFVTKIVTTGHFIIYATNLTVAFFGFPLVVTKLNKQNSML